MASKEIIKNQFKFERLLDFLVDKKDELRDKMAGLDRERGKLAIEVQQIDHALKHLNKLLENHLAILEKKKKDGNNNSIRKTNK